MASAAGLVHAAAARRLVHDLKEVIEHPVPNVSALPLDDDIFTWHGNVRSSPDSILQGVPIHFILKFPKDYPQKEPEVRLLQALPHPNLQRPAGIQVLGAANAAGTNVNSNASLSAHKSRPLPREARWRLAMWDCIPGHNSWSSAYSVLSVLLQLQVFLLDEDLHYDTQRTTPQQAISAATALTCPHCTHSGADNNSVYPPFPTQQQLDQALNMRAKLTVARPFVPARSRVTAEQLRQHQRPLVAASTAANGVQRSAAGSKSPSPCPSVVEGKARVSDTSSNESSSAPSASTSPASSRPASSSGTPTAAAAAAVGASDGWTTVQHKHQTHHHQHHGGASYRGGYGGRGRGRGAGRGGWSSTGRGGMHGDSPSSGTVFKSSYNRGGSGMRGRRGAGRGAGGRGGQLQAPSSSGNAAAGHHHTPATSQHTHLQHQQQPPQQVPKQQQQVVTGGSFAAFLATPAAATAAGAAVVPSAPPQTQQQQPIVGAAAPQPLTKAAKKNAARKARRQQQSGGTDASTPSAAAIHSTNPKNSTPSQQQQQQAPKPPKPQQQQKQQQKANDWIDVKPSKAQQKASLSQLLVTPLQAQLKQLQQQPMQDLVAAARAGTALLVSPTDPSADAADSDCTSSADQYPCSSNSGSGQYGLSPAAAAAQAAKLAAAGPFGALGRDALLEILCLLEPTAVAALGQTCVALHEAVEDGAVWQVMMSKAFPGHRLKPSNMTEWKAAFQLESACILDELRCWMTRAGPEEDVLGLPITYTTNPATKKVDYILAHPDVLSVTAFKMGVRVTPQGDKFDALLPLYLTASHFNRALPHMAHLLPLLAPEAVGRGGTAPPPETWLEVLAKILNTQVVLLSDNGLSVSQRSLSVYCQVHRLLLAVCEHWCLWSAVARKLDAWANNPATRTKSGTPNMGLLLPLLAVGNPSRHGWNVLADGILLESLSRKVLWMCKKDPSLVKRFCAPRGSPADPQLLSGTWEGAAVSAKLLGFHVAFLKLVSCPAGATLESVMDSADALFGWPAAALGVRFQRVVRRIQELSNWREWFTLLGRAGPSDQAMSDLLRWAWSSGAAKGYHSVNTDFTRIHKSGVSTILLKGQSYAMPPAAKSVDLVVHYKWRPEVHVYYLDGAVLLMGAGRRLIEQVAWNQQSSTLTARPGAVTHSGDIMEFDQQKGANNAHINFAGLGPEVVEVFVTLSAWNTAVLSDIVQPYVQLKEPDTGVELCQIQIDALQAAAKRTYKCIIMARFYKGQDGKWTVANVGTLCQGDTSNNEDMVAGCRAVV